MDGFILKLPEGHDVFRKMCERYSEMKGVDRDGLSIERLKAMVRERKLDGLVKNLIKMLIRYANVFFLRDLRSAELRVEELLRELLGSGEMNEDIKQGLKRAIKVCIRMPYPFKYIWNDLGVREMSEELSRSGELDDDVKFVLKVAIKSANPHLLKPLLRDLPNARSLLKELLCTMPRARELARKLLSAKEFNETTEGCSKRPAEECSTHSLRSTKRARTSE